MLDKENEFLAGFSNRNELQLASRISTFRAFYRAYRNAETLHCCIINIGVGLRWWGTVDIPIEPTVVTDIFSWNGKFVIVA